MSDWFYASGGAQQGPVSLEMLRTMAASGSLKGSDLVWSQGMTAWQPAFQIGGLFPAGSTPPPLSAAPVAMAPMPYATPGSYGSTGPSLGDDPGVRWLLPVGRSGWAIAAGYLGLFSVLVIPAPFALACAILAIREIRKNPQRHGMGRAIFGLIMGALFTLVLVLAISVGVFGHHR